MNSELLLRAMEHIDERYILHAEKRLGYLGNAVRPRRRSMKRIFTVALAAALALVCTLAAAMAVSPEFREAIISLFQVGEIERVPQVPETNSEVKQVTIGGEVSAQYVKVDGIWGADSGLGLLQRRDAADGQSHFYDVAGGELVEVGADASEISTSVSWYGRTINVHLRFFVYHDALYLNNSYGGSCEEDGMTFWVFPERLGSRTDVVLLRGECCGSEADTNWAWVCDLDTGEVRDVLAGCGLEKFPYMERVLLTEDLKHALIRGWDGASDSGITPYLADLEEKTCTPLGQLMGLDIPTAFGSYEATFYDSDTVLLAMAPLWRPEPTSVWAYHIPSGTVTPTAENEEELTSITPEADVYGWALAQKVDENGNVTIVDLRTGRQVKLEGITAADRCYLKLNGARTRLLWVDWGAYGLNRLGVIDLESGEFTAFQRENMELHYNEAVFWLDDDRVVTRMNLHTGDHQGPSTLNEYYLCIYEF